MAFPCRSAGAMARRVGQPGRDARVERARHPVVCSHQERTTGPRAWRLSMRVALIVPGFSADEEDWCIPALLNFVRALAQRVELEVFALRYPHRRGQYRIGNASVHSFGYATRRGPASLALWREA